VGEKAEEKGLVLIGARDVSASTISAGLKETDSVMPV